MVDVLLLNLVFFVPATCGATAFAVLVWRFLVRGSEPPGGDDGGGPEAPVPSAGPDDLARSA